MEKRTRGRPRINPDKLVRWKPPEDWVRVVAWVSPEERKSLKRFATEADTSVAELIRSLASGLEHGAIGEDELLRQVRKGQSVMEKIPTIFQRGDNFRVTNQVHPDCSWVLDGEGIATEKLDGTNVRLTIRSGKCVRLEKRKNPNKKQKTQGIKDGWYVEADELSPEDKWIYECMLNTDVSSWPDGEHSSEALGPKIQGNPLKLKEHICVPFDMEIPTFDNIERSFDGLKEALSEMESKYSPTNLVEGIVFHHVDGRRAKIKRKDFA